MGKGNKNSAKEDDLGELHGLVTKLHRLKASYLLKAIAKLEFMIESMADDFDFDSIIVSLNNMKLTELQKWVEYNGIGCNIAEEDEESKLSKDLKTLMTKQEGNLVQFKDIMEG